LNASFGRFSRYQSIGIIDAMTRLNGKTAIATGGGAGGRRASCQRPGAGKGEGMSVIFLAWPKSDFVPGQAIVVDGVVSMH
jgi:hypothetical protein